MSGEIELGGFHKGAPGGVEAGAEGLEIQPGVYEGDLLHGIAMAREHLLKAHP